MHDIYTWSRCGCMCDNNIIGTSECKSDVRYGVVERSYSTRSRFEAALWELLATFASIMQGQGPGARSRVD